MNMDRHGGMIFTGENRRTRRETCPSAALSTTNPTWNEPGSYWGLRRVKPATNRMSHGTAIFNVKGFYFILHIAVAQIS
jgi:hypothetical protein